MFTRLPTAAGKTAETSSMQKDGWDERQKEREKNVRIRQSSRSSRSGRRNSPRRNLLPLEILRASSWPMELRKIITSATSPSCIVLADLPRPCRRQTPATGRNRYVWEGPYLSRAGEHTSAAIKDDPNPVCSFGFFLLGSPSRLFLFLPSPARLLLLLYSRGFGIRGSLKRRVMAVVKSSSSKPEAQRGITAVGVLSEGSRWSRAGASRGLVRRRRRERRRQWWRRSEWKEIKILVVQPMKLRAGWLAKHGTHCLKWADYQWEFVSRSMCLIRKGL